MPSSPPFSGFLRRREESGVFRVGPLIEHMRSAHSEAPIPLVRRNLRPRTMPPQVQPEPDPNRVTLPEILVYAIIVAGTAWFVVELFG